MNLCNYLLKSIKDTIFGRYKKPDILHKLDYPKVDASFFRNEQNNHFEFSSRMHNPFNYPIPELNKYYRCKLGMVLDFKCMYHCEYQQGLHAISYRKIVEQRKYFGLHKQTFGSRDFYILCESRHKQEYFDYLKQFVTGNIDGEHRSFIKEIAENTHEENRYFPGWWDVVNHVVILTDRKMAIELADHFELDHAFSTEFRKEDYGYMRFIPQLVLN